jgi:hypothetical protein
VAEARRTPDNRAAIAPLITAMYAKLAPDDSRIDARTAARWEMAIAESLWDQGQHQQAIDQFTALQSRFPHVVDIQIRFAQLISRDPRAEWVDHGIELWRSIAAGSKPRSETWFTAKYELARLLVAHGQWNEAEKVLRYLKTVPPGWDESSLKNEFEALLAEVSQKNAAQK